MNSLKIQACFLFLSCFLNGQNFQKDYKPLSNYNPGKNYFSAIKNGFDSIYQSLDYVNKAERLTFKAALQDNKNTLQALADENLLMKHDVISDYLQVMTRRIVQENPILTGRNFEVLIYRSTVPNAANYGNGIILFNLNLLSRFSREEYVAFTICHEISHEIKKHVINGIRHSYQLKNDPAMKARFEKIRKQEYRRLTSYEAYVTDYVYKATSKRRAAEIEADSLGILLYCNAGYKKEHALRALEMLDSIDNSARNEKINYTNIFNNGDFRFKREWLNAPEDENEGFGGNVEEKQTADTLKTHPDCKVRKEKLSELVVSGGTYIGKPDIYKDVVMTARFEMLELYSRRKEISKGLYEALQWLGVYPDNAYLKAKVEEFLLELYYAKINHQVILLTDKPDKSFSSEYNSLINFINAIGSEDLLDCARAYFKANFDTVIIDPYVAYVFTLLKLTDKDQETTLAIIRAYETNFGANDYLSELKIKFGIQK